MRNGDAVGPRYDLIVIGSGPAGHHAAIQAAKLGRRVAIVERRREVGGVCINTGTIPSKTLREAVLDLSGLRQRSLYGPSYRGKADITVADLFYRTDQVMVREREVVKAQLLRNNIQLFEGEARFEGPHRVRVGDSDAPQQLEGTFILIATGTKPGVPAGLEVDHVTVLTSDDILSLPRLPRALTVVGAGIVGVEYATIFAALGVEVTLLDMRPALLDLVDRELVDAFAYQARGLGGTMRLGEEVARRERGPGGAVVVLKSGKRMATEMVLVSAGRVGTTADLGLEKVGLGTDARGRIAVDERYRTAVPHIYAAGDVIGFPALA